MSYFLLTAVYEHDAEDPLLLAATLEEAQAAAPLAVSAGTTPNWFTIYQAEVGEAPVPVLAARVTYHWDDYSRRLDYALNEWKTA